MQEQVAKDIRRRLEAVRENVARACERCGRDAAGVRIVAVSKFHPAEAVVAALGAGQLLFGENRVQEAAAKFDGLRTEGHQCELHIIGQLQRNKAREAVRIADCIESVDRVELLEELERHCMRQEKRIGVLLELHTAEETKAGFASEDALSVALERCMHGDFPHLEPRGLMTMAPNTTDEALVRESFARTRECALRLRQRFPGLALEELSMGMSGDYELAIAEGATIVRIGTAIFGSRDGIA